MDPRFHKFLTFTIVASLVATAAHAQTVIGAKAECEQLMNAALPFAQQMLERHGEFFPYGQAINSDGKVVSVAAHDEREHPPSEDVIRQLRQVFSAEAKSGKYKATALIYDVRVQLPTTGMKSDAIAVALDHRDNYSVVVFLPYRLEGSKLVMGEVFAEKGAADIFAHH
jgi:hypothetical protein